MVLLNHEACKAKTTQTCTIHNHCLHIILDYWECVHIILDYWECVHIILNYWECVHIILDYWESSRVCISLGVIKGGHALCTFMRGGGGGGGGLRFYIASVVEANQVNKLQ